MLLHFYKTLVICVLAVSVRRHNGGKIGTRTSTNYGDKNNAGSQYSEVSVCLFVFVVSAVHLLPI